MCCISVEPQALPTVCGVSVEPVCGVGLLCHWPGLGLSLYYDWTAGAAGVMLADPDGFKSLHCNSQMCFVGFEAYKQSYEQLLHALSRPSAKPPNVSASKQVTLKTQKLRAVNKNTNSPNGYNSGPSTGYRNPSPLSASPAPLLRGTVACALAGRPVWNHSKGLNLSVEMFSSQIRSKFSI